jgi:predicted nucleic acid-binding protein
MILVDTSVWIEYFRRNQDYMEVLQSMLGHRRIITLEPVFSELLYGARGRRDKRLITSYWDLLPRAEFGASSMIQAAEYANKQNFQQLGIGLVDALIIHSTIIGDHLLWTLDKRINSNIDHKYMYQSSHSP